MAESIPPSSRTRQAAQHPAIWTGFTLGLVVTVRAFFGDKVTETQAQALMGLAGTVGTLIAYYLPPPPPRSRKGAS